MGEQQGSVQEPQTAPEQGPAARRGGAGYVVLARKYRPRRFDEVTGQETVTGTLQGAIRADRIAHAYLLCGPRGTGKTTTARIFAKALNCEHGPTPDPCGECERCRSIERGEDVDVVEIDAASHTGVENVRDLRDQAAYAPLRSRFKVYIVDEVHMLSKQAFNAFLKTLEEPPPHVKFVFATTEPYRLLDTVRSRCQTLQLAALSEATIAARLDEVFGLEGIRAGEGVSHAIARRARGGMRDALTLADQLLALGGRSPQLADVARIAGATDQDVLAQVVEALLASDGARLLELLPRDEGDEQGFLDALLDHVRATLLLCTCGPDTPLVDAGPEARAASLERGRRMGAERLQLALDELLHARQRMQALKGQERLVLELCLLELARPGATVPLEELAARLLALEERLDRGEPLRELPAAAPPAATRPAPARTRPAPKASAPAGTSGPAPAGASPAPERAPRRAARGAAGTAAEAWESFLAAMEESSPSLGETLRRRARLVERGGGRAVVRLENLLPEERTMLADARNRRRCARTFSEVMGEETELSMEDSAEVRPGEEDPFTRRIAERFDGRIEG